MNFKRIEVCGFKSFADPTRVEFEDGITGIVGPNGCGKSNVADAIRWVLGEQSAKLLRGKNMQDVIFKGTDRRSELSVCEVTLTFDNTNGIFPNFDFQEVSITRKLYKSGESEYKINGTNCRLKDIQDLIRDTGLGREGYSIVGQGRIDEIVNARPKDRRCIFEDAAGVLKFKQRKIESERKLERTQENIDRLSDIMIEIHRQLTPLEKQSNDAKRFLEIRDSLRILESNEFVYRKENLDEQTSVIECRLKALSEDYNNQVFNQHQADKDFADIRAEQNNIDAYISKLRDEQTAMAVVAEGIKGKGNTLNERIAGIKEQKNNFTQRLTQMEAQIEAKGEELSDFVNRMNMAQEELAEVTQEYNEKTVKHLALVDEILQREKQIEGSNAEMLRAIESIGDIKADLSKLLTEKEISLNRIGELEDEINVLKGHIENDEKLKLAMESNVERLFKEKTKLAKNKNEVQSEVVNLRAELDNNKDKAGEMNSTINALQTKCKILEDFKNDNENLGAAVKNLLNASKENLQVKQAVLGVIADIITVPSKFETAIEMALGNAVRNVVTANEKDTNFLIEFLKRYNLGRVTFLPITSFKAKELESHLRGILDEEGCLGVASELIDCDPKFYSIMSGLLGKVVVFDTMQNAIQTAKKYKYATKMVTLDGDIINPTGSMTGGSKKSDSGSVFKQAREIERTKELLIERKKSLEILMRKIKTDSDDLQELMGQLSEYEEEVKLAEVSYATENQKLDKILSRLNSYIEDLNAKNESKQKIVNKVDAINLAISTIDKKGENVQDLKNCADDEATKRKNEFDQKRMQKDELSAQLTTLKVEMAAIEKEAHLCSENIIRLRKECEELNADVIDTKRYIKELEQKLYDTENSLNTVVVSEEEKQKYQALIDKINSLDQYKGKLSDKMTAILTKKDQLSALMQTLTESRIKQENLLDKLQSNMIALEAHIYEEYELTYEGALSLKIEDFDLATAAPEINKLRKEKTALGSVNLDAIEMYKEQGARYDEMVAQKNDLVATANDCIDIIEDMSKEMKTRFEEAFKKINANFQSVFQELFGGGEGNLIIEKVESGEDPLEAGIEIMARLPGKSLKSITLFSGGEKALIAIAILFAILRLKAMPFCVLDEIEAALDDANAGLFAKYLSRFSKETQFIVITHRKPTMELADRLYGVTMQEKGISKVVTVSLAEAVKQTSEN